MEFFSTRAVLIVTKGAPNARPPKISGIVHSYEEWYRLGIQVNRISQRTGSTICTVANIQPLASSPAPNRTDYPIAQYNGVSGSLSSLLRLY